MSLCEWTDTEAKMSAERLCVVCMCDFEDGEAVVECGRMLTSKSLSAPECEASAALECAGHVVHAEGCLTQYLTVAAQEKATHDFYKEHRVIRCPCGATDCGNALSDVGVLRSGSGAAISAYFAALREIACTVERREVIARVEREAMQASGEANRNLAQRMVTDVREVLTQALSCPHCNVAFLDFSGCLSLSCAACGREFCGVCCRVHKESKDGHECVRNCVAKLPPAEVQRYDFHSTYFISAVGWGRWSERLKVDALLTYFKTLRREVVWESFATVRQALEKEQLLSSESCELLAKRVYSHDVDAVHLVRIPNTFWLLYSTKKNCKFEDVINTVFLSQAEKLAVGKVILSRVLASYPSWVAVKNTVPGERFEAINYPPEFLPLITKVIDEWGRGKYW